MNRKTGVLLSYVLMILEVLSTLLLTPFIIRTLGGAEYGVFKLAAAISSYLLLLDLGVGNAVTRFLAKYRTTGQHDLSRKFLGISILFYAGIAVLTLIVGGLLVALFPSIFAKGLSAAEIHRGQILLAITTANAAVMLGTACFSNGVNAYERFDVSRGASIIQILVRIAMTVIVLKRGMGSIGIVSVNLLTTVLCRAFYAYFVIGKLHLHPVFHNIDSKLLAEVIGYSAYILIQMVATQVNAFADSVLLGMLVPASAALIGVYSIGQQISQYYQTIGSSVNGVLMPGVVRMVEQGAPAEQLEDEMVRIGRMILCILGAIYVGLLLFGRQFITLWVGAENLEGYEVAVLLLTAYLFILTEAIGTQILWAKNEHREQALLKMGVVVVNVVLTVFLIRWKPIFGAALGTFISLILGDVGVMNYVFYKKFALNLKRYYLRLFKGILPCLLVGAAAGWLIRGFALPGWLGLLANILIFVLVYGGAMLWFGFNPYEKQFFSRMLKRGRK